MEDAVEFLMQPGSIGVIPTDTVYGVVARVSDQTAVKRLYDLKNRDHKPGTVIAASIDQLVQIGVKKRYLTAVSQYWPGAVSVVIPHRISYLSQEVGNQPFRIPNSKQLEKLLSSTGPLLTSSANQPGQPPANNINEAKKYFGDQVDFYIDGGDMSGHQPSTIIRIIDDAIEIIRLGAVNIDDSGRIIK